MAKNRKNTKSMLLDLHYKHPRNTFEEFYGYSISYSEIEQVSYIDLKEMSFEKIDERIKFRKFGRDNGVLTVKMDVTPNELEKFMAILEYSENNVIVGPKGFNFLHDFVITNVRDLTNEERIRFKKDVVEEASDDSVDDSN